MKTLQSLYQAKLDNLSLEHLRYINERTGLRDGPSAQLSSMYEYLILFGKQPNPTVINVPTSGISHALIESYLRNSGWDLLKIYGYVGEKSERTLPFGQLWVHLQKETIIQISLLQATKSNIKYGADLRQHEWQTGDLDMGIDDDDSEGHDRVFVSDIIIKHPSVFDKLYDEEWVFRISKEIIQFKNEDTKEASIQIVTKESGDYAIKAFSLANKTPKLSYLDLHYGKGFSDFNDKLLQKLNKNTKGLVLFHGEPGTGKTHYIRYLLNELAKLNKSVIYFSPSMASQITDPSFMSFLSEWITENDKDVILLIEDAEPLLQTRITANRSEGISNLLNLTDGILNDMLGVTVICTFNTEIGKIDSALLRPERLVARKYFSKLSELDSYNLAVALELPVPECDNYPISLADFYSKKHESEILEHGVMDKATNIGFKK